MVKRREQLTVSPAKFEDDVYEYLEELSKKRKLSVKMHEWARQELHGSQSLIQEEIRELRQEMRELRQLLLGGRSNMQHGIFEPMEPVQPMMLVSSDRVNRILDEEDLNYNF